MNDTQHGYSSDELGLEPIEFYSAREAEYRKKIREHDYSGSLSGAGWPMLALAWALEKQGRGNEGLLQAEEARTVLRDSADRLRLAECCHSIGVWRFHHVADAVPTDDFLEAVEHRLAGGDLMMAAQSWHNLGYVQLISGSWLEAEASYASALELLGAVQKEGGARAESAFRQCGFVLSHQGMLHARHRSTVEALEAALLYFEHFEITKAHREPVLAYLAPGVALARNPAPRGTEELCGRLKELTGIEPEAEAWLRYAVQNASAAMVTSANTGTGRRAYLGSHILALAELARWAYQSGNATEADALVENAESLARARGWTGEAERVRRIKRPYAPLTQG